MILTNVTHKEAAWIQRCDGRTPPSWNYLVPRRWRTKGTEGWLRAAVPAGFLSQIDLRSHPSEPPRGGWRAAAWPGSPRATRGLHHPRPPRHSPFRTTSYIYLRISLFFDWPALFASSSYRKHVLPVITPADRAAG